MSELAVIDESVPNVLFAAAAVIDAHGWNQLDMWPNCCKEIPWVPGTPCCALGAIIVASGHTEVFGGARQLPAVKYMASWISEVKYPDNRDQYVYAFTISHWNDRKSRTKSDVVNGLRTAGIKARAQIQAAEDAAVALAGEVDSDAAQAETDAS